MGIVLHWFLPANGDSRSDLSLGNAVGVAGSRATGGGTERIPDIGQIARQRYDLSDHCRSARTHASHDPVDWEYHHAGNYLLHNSPPPDHGQL